MPPVKKEGHVVIKSSGLMFGKVCMDGLAYQNLTSFGCPIARIMKDSKLIQADNSTVTRYNIIVSTPNPPGYFQALLSFSHPVSVNSVTFSGVYTIIQNMQEFFSIHL